MHDDDGLEGLVHDRHAGPVVDDDFADSAVGLFHQRHVGDAVFLDFQTQLGAADADRRHRRIDRHGIGIGLGGHAGDERKQPLGNAEGDGALLGGRIVDHFIEGDPAIGRHRERRPVGQRDAEGTVAGCDLVALKHGIADRQTIMRTVGAGDGDLASEGFHLADCFRFEGLHLADCFRHAVLHNAYLAKRSFRPAVGTRDCPVNGAVNGPRISYL